MKIPFNKSYVTKKDIENVKISMVKESLEEAKKDLQIDALNILKRISQLILVS